MLMTVFSCIRKHETYPSNLNISPAGKNSSLPNLTKGPDDTFLLSWVETIDSIVKFKYATGNNNGWSTPTTIDSSTNWFINWADYPSVVHGSDNHTAAHVLKYNGKGTFQYDIWMYIHSGKSWSKFLLNTDGVPAEHGFVSIVPYDTGFFVSWLDGRNTPATDDSSGHQGHHGSMSLRGAIISNAGQKINEWEIDSRTCDCCQTAAVVTNTGPAVIYRDRTESEIRDISITRLVNGNWTPPENLSGDEWKVNGCPVNGPRALSLDNKLAVVWYTAGKDEPAVYFTVSENNGESFDKPIRVDTGNPIGRVALAAFPNEQFLVSWVEDSKILARLLDKSGVISEPLVIAESSDSRAGGFPQMTIVKEMVLFAWTDIDSGKIETKTLQQKDFTK